MNLFSAQQLANRLIREHLSNEWTFAWNRRQSAFGVCSYSKKEIQLSKILTAHGEESRVKNTILHEIAHALAGPGTGHGPVWKTHARRIGCTAERVAASTAAEKAAIRYTYQIIHRETGEVINKYQRKPGKKIVNKLHEFYIPGRKTETLGKLVLQKI